MFLISHDYFEIRHTKKKGKGVFALQPIKEGTTIGKYHGKITRYEEINPKDYEFLMYLNDQEGIVADRNEIGVHLMNHSCEPNCTMDIKKKGIFFVAIHDIQPDEELTINYNYPPKDTCTDCIHQCFCGSKNCTGTMHSTF